MFIVAQPEKHKNSYLALSDPSDVASGESRHLLAKEIDAGPYPTGWTWRNAVHQRQNQPRPDARAHHVCGAVPGPLGAEDPKLGVEITDSVVVLTRTMTRWARPLEKWATTAFFCQGAAPWSARRWNRAKRTWPGPRRNQVLSPTFLETREI